jgi:hypothetical protein
LLRFVDLDPSDRSVPTITVLDGVEDAWKTGLSSGGPNHGALSRLRRSHISRARPAAFARAQAARTGSPAERPHRATLAAIIESGPIPAVHGVVPWRIVDLCQWIFEEIRVFVAKQTLSRELRAMGYRKLSARPRHHAQAAGAIKDLKEAFPRAWKRSGARRTSSSAP